MLNRSEPSDARRQQLSSLMDGDLSAADAAGACAHWHHDTDARRDWHAYHLIGDVMRSDDLATTPARDAAFLQALRQRLADEPVPLAPAPLQAPVRLDVPQVANGAVAARRPRPARHWLMAPAAVAAGFVAVAGVMVVTRVMAPAPADPAVLAGVGGVPATSAAAVLVRNAQLDRYLAAHRSLANGAMPGAGAERRVHIVFEGQ